MHLTTVTWPDGQSIVIEDILDSNADNWDIQTYDYDWGDGESVTRVNFRDPETLEDYFTFDFYNNSQLTILVLGPWLQWIRQDNREPINGNMTYMPCDLTKPSHGGSKLLDATKAAFLACGMMPECKELAPNCRGYLYVLDEEGTVEKREQPPYYTPPECEDIPLQQYSPFAV